MKRHPLGFIIMALSAALLPAPAPLSAQDAKADFSQHPVLRKLLGEWTGDGSLQGADGETIRIHEEWTGKTTEGGTFLMSGTRQWNEETHQFSWEFIYNPSTESIEVSYRATNAGDEPLRFETSVSEADLSILMKAPIGVQGELNIINRVLEENGTITLEGLVSLKDDNQQETLSGKVTHRPRKS